MSSTETTRAALVTGGSGGIGRAVAERLAADGMAVGVHYAGNKARAEEVVAAIETAGGRAIAVGGDVADPEEMAAAFDAVEQAFGGVDVVVNTAGIMVLSPIAELDLDDLDRMHRTNIRGTVVVAQLAARRVRSGGAIIAFSTTVTRLSFPTYGAYVASKGAVEALVPVLAREMRGRDVTVNAVAPGPTATPLFLDGKSEEQIAGLAAAPPLERLGQPDDIAEAVAFLAGPARWVNGQTLFANGGLA
ncbi:SDR family oxidoreductase [Actinomycetospora straminea]|uniref:SDR family oxidoreductase n=1 Tax=Actinomycetospora straminea TaxID=663607 RepID=A0ABP9F958_9PSEU|nr:SDR family oxidoreductase [Actinomycetospora straminea]MDD7936595.1 SDR family oxidoreductase [Actinomycetospora straminea]